jgi:hypothetical protein
MTDDASKQSKQPLQGEGNYSATRRYNQHLGEAIAEGDLEAAADAARRAVEGPEGAELERAAEQAKQGPKQAPAPRVAAQEVKKTSG